MIKEKRLKDLALKLNMSISTVSKALNNDASISKLTKERVQKQAIEWNYKPNESARNLKLNKSFAVGLIMPDLLDQFYVFAVNGIEEVRRCASLCSLLVVIELISAVKLI